MTVKIFKRLANHFESLFETDIFTRYPLLPSIRQQNLPFYKKELVTGNTNFENYKLLKL